MSPCRTTGSSPNGQCRSRSGDVRGNVQFPRAFPRMLQLETATSFGYDRDVLPSEERYCSAPQGDYTLKSATYGSVVSGFSCGNNLVI